MPKTFYYNPKKLQIDDITDKKTKKDIIAEFKLDCPEIDLQEIEILPGECATVSNGVLSKYNIKQHDPDYNWKAEYAKLLTADARIAFIAKRLGFI